MTSIILVGPRCVGKTETGEALASIRHVPFVDADRVFERHDNTTIKDFVAKFGWSRFRQCETLGLSCIIGEYSDRNIVLAPGGGAVAHNQGENYRAENVNMLRRFGQLVYLLPAENLEESARILVERAKKDPKSVKQRPSLNDGKTEYDKMLKTLTERDSLYREAAHHTFYTRDMTPSQVAWSINDLVR
jgi:shikimate kinase